jgi:cytidine deaminase
MENRQLTINYLVYESESEFPEHSRELLQAAKGALDSAYAPYSHFQVAAALRLDNGEIICGTNQENAAYPSGLCAERTALFYAGSAFPGSEVVELFVIARKEGSSELLPACPCGGCRQVMQETEFRQGKEIKVFFRMEKSGFIQLNSVADILPFRFDPASLK